MGLLEHSTCCYIDPSTTVANDIAAIDGLRSGLQCTEKTEYERAREAMATQQLRAERRAMEATTDLILNCVDMDEPFLGPNGERWQGVGTCDRDGTATDVNSETWLTEIRCRMRDLAERNEFAICGHENRVNYIVGTGHAYTVTKKPELKEVADETLADVQAVIDRFTKENKWAKRQQEIVWRKDRDGECFLRFFPDSTPDDEGVATADLRIRFVEPGQVSTPPDKQADNQTFGIVTDLDDVETVEGYYIDGELVPADEIQHRKENVDANVKRGMPLFYPVEKNLRRTEKVLRNMTVVASIQSAIALIRKHDGAGAGEAATTNWVQGHANYSQTHGTQPTTYHEKFAAGTILDAPSNTEYDFPTAAIDSSKYVGIIQAELRAIACRLVMPEFMLTSDASNANYSSTMVAEGPAVKMFERWQADMVEDDKEVMDRVLALAVEAQELTQEQVDQIDIDVTLPTLTTRDRLQETQADQIMVNGKAMSIPTWQQRNDLDPEHETELIDAQTEKNMANMDAFGGFGQSDDGDTGQDSGDEPDNNDGAEPSNQDS